MFLRFTLFIVSILAFGVAYGWVALKVAQPTILNFKRRLAAKKRVKPSCAYCLESINPDSTEGAFSKVDGWYHISCRDDLLTPEDKPRRLT